MPGMSARIKAKKGRYGVEGLIHTVQITSPASGSSFSLAGSPAEFPFAATGKVTDDLGAVTEADIVWTSDVDGSVGANGSPTAITLTTLGAHVITATVTNGTQVVTDTINVTVVA